MRKLAIALLPAALTAAPLALAAPPPQHPAPMPAPTAGTATVSQATLHKFANAYKEVMQLRTKYVGRIRTAKNKEEKTALKRRATNEMKQHIARYMSVRDYIKVGKEINASPALRQRLMAILRSDERTAPPASATGG